ncbi:unnamed protein product [Arabis nemorensis]|uniref:Ubiquitin-like protease family profile domain-containing protein n=1 Tax=Arabis nemorensis TaxID=586526 RepID=A0A565CB09_9BRAS|nr:unnamed protein product [Arabis nemorensis]
MASNTVLAMFKTLTEKVDNMEINLHTKLLSAMDAAIDTKVKALLAPFTEKLVTLEKEIEKLREKNVPADPKEAANSNANTNEEVTSKDMSWMVQMKTTSQNDLPICVVKTVKKAGKKKAGEKRIVKTEIQVPHLLDLSSGKTYTDPLQHDILKGVTENLDAIVAKVTKLTNLTPLPKRQTKLAPSQLFPFVGNSTVKRIIAGVTPSVTAYDPFAEVDNNKIQKLLHFQLDTGEKPDGTNDSSVEFYKIIITPRDAWSTDTYGWLNSSHMWCAMHIFHQRSLCEPSPYHSQRIVFLDQWFVYKLVRDYKEFNAKTWTATDNYKGAFNGTYPADSATNKKWLHDVDHMYACHCINGNHWVAFDIDIGKENIHVYDNILNLVEDDKVIRNECRPFAMMVPAILNAMVPTCVRKRSDKQFAVRRLRNVSQNEKPGDCGVYAIKYIECLAIGCTFEGVNDRNIPQLRKKLAAAIYDEIGLPRMTHR